MKRASRRLHTVGMLNDAVSKDSESHRWDIDVECNREFNIYYVEYQ